MVSKGPENTFIASVHRHLPTELYKIKNHNIYNSGQPDCWYSGSKADLWIEYKFITIPKRPDTLITIELSELQKNWLRSRNEEGRNVAVVVGSKDGGVYFPGNHWEHPVSAEKFRRLISTRQGIAATITKFCLSF